MVKPRVLLSFALVGSLLFVALAAAPLPDPRFRNGWRVDLELTPGAALPFFGRFASADVSIYPEGMTASSTFLRAWIRNQAGAVRVEHVIARLYSDVPVSSIRPTLLSLAGVRDSVIPSLNLRVDPPQKGKVRGLDAHRYRMRFTKQGYLDVWTTTVFPENQEFRRLQREFLTAVSPSAAAAAAKLPGTPVYVELNTPRHQKVVLLRLDKVVIDVPRDEREKALSTGRVYAKAPFSDRFWTR